MSAAAHTTQRASRLNESANAYIDFIIPYVITTLRPPDLPGPQSLCGVALSKAIQFIRRLVESAYNSTKNSRKPAYDIIKQQPEFMNAVVSFTFSVTSEDQIKAFEERISPCCCTLSERFIRELHNDAKTADFFPTLSQSFFFFATFLVSFTPASLYRSMDNGKRNRDKILKEAIYCMLEGAQATVDAIACWYQYPPARNSVIARFMHSCIEAHPTFLPSISSPSGQQLLSAFSSDLHKEILDLQNGTPLTASLVESMNLHAVLIEIYLKKTQQPFSTGMLESFQAVSFLFYEVYLDLNPSDKKMLEDSGVSSTMADIGALTLPIGVDPETNSMGIRFSDGMANVLNNPHWVRPSLASDAVYFFAWSTLDDAFRQSGGVASISVVPTPLEATTSLNAQDAAYLVIAPKNARK